MPKRPALPAQSNDPLDPPPVDRTLAARIAAHERWARTQDRTTATAPARAGLRRKFALEIDPEGVMDPARLESRIEQRMHAHMLRMSLAARKARQARARKNGQRP